MYRVYTCLTQEHDYLLLGLAVLVCWLGSALTVLLAKRLLRASHWYKTVLFLLTTATAAAAVWATHFIAMLAYQPDYVHGYDPWLTGVSLAVGAVGMGLAFAMLAYSPRGVMALFAGGVFGLTISALHFVGMEGYRVPGEIVWHFGGLLIAVLLGVALGAVTFAMIGQRYSRLRWMLCSLSMVATISAIHFTAMVAFEVALDPTKVVPPEVTSDQTLGIIIVSVMLLILSIGLGLLMLDLSLEAEARMRVKHATQHDQLTGLPNRQGLAQKFVGIKESCAHGDARRIALMTIDLNLFTEVNDLHGHEVGDQVLQELTRRLIELKGPTAFFARVGGDEFVAVYEGFETCNQVVRFAERISAAMFAPICMGNDTFTVGASIGIANCVDDGRDLQELLKKSNLAMYRAKADNERDICLYSEALDQQSAARLQLVQSLRQAVTQGGFTLAYQLQNDILTLAPTGFEALLRWDHPKRGPIAPGEFIPLAEEAGLIGQLGLWVLKEACQEASGWPAPFSVAVNVSPQQLDQTGFAEKVAAILQQTGLPPHRLELEITEDTFIRDKANALLVMGQLKDMGIRVAMDDFGTGYSSLATLQDFPFDKIKIDRSFIHGVHLDKQKAAIVRATMLLGEALDIPVLAEGVEQAEELAFLQGEHCAAVQGFYFGKPMPAKEARAIMIDAQQLSA